MSEKPILFSAPMVRAILEGRKTQTRRAAHVSVPVPLADAARRCPYWADTLWVRETWFSPPKPHNDCLGYAADNDFPHGVAYRMRPSIHMPRTASRITLRVTSVRFERLQDISWNDALAEGVRANGVLPWSPVDAFRELWDSINFDRAPWRSNPWVWVIEFERRP